MTERSAPRFFCFGLGYSASALAARLAARGWRLAGTTRDAAKAEALRRTGIEAFLFDRARPLADPAAALAGTTHLLSSVPPDQSGDPVLDRHGADIAACRTLAWAGYLSTTGVYGDRGGAWVDEETAPAPNNLHGQRRLAAERGWLALQRDHGLPVQIFRLAGIYGPGRNSLERVKAGTARRIDAPAQLFGRIHLADIATVLEASIARPNPGRIYNLCDDEPAPPAEVVDYACTLLGVEASPLEPLATATLSAMARGFYRDNKRVSNARIKEELGVTLAYPDYRVGLAALLDSDG